MGIFPAPKFNTFTLDRFELESGVVLPQVNLAYRISGTPSSQSPIVTCAAFSQSYYDVAYLRGAKLALDPKKDWIIHTELLGNGRSSSPSNTSPPFNGANFFFFLQAALLNHLGVNRIRAVVGASMGGQQAIQWAVSYPDRVENAVVIAGSCRATWHVRLFLNSLATCIRSDPAFQEGIIQNLLCLGCHVCLKLGHLGLFRQSFIHQRCIKGILILRRIRWMNFWRNGAPAIMKKMRMTYYVIFRLGQIMMLV